MIRDPANLQTDFFLLRDGPICVTSDRALWQTGTDWLRLNRGYKTHSWKLRSETEFYHEVSKTVSWNGNLDALSDGVNNWPLAGDARVAITVDNADRLKNWFGNKTNHIWDILQEAARMQLLFGVRMLVMVNTSSEGEATRWAKASGVSKLTGVCSGWGQNDTIRPDVSDFSICIRP